MAAPSAPAPSTAGSAAPGIASVDAATPAAIPRPGDGSAGFCRAVRGPVELPIRSPAALAVHGERVDAVLDDDGRPRVTTFSAAPFAATAPVWTPPAREPADGVVSRGLRLQCARPATSRSAPTHRRHPPHQPGGRRTTGSSPAAGPARASLRRPLGGTHTALAYLASRQTSEGWVSEAWLAVDDDAPIRLSEDGSGATALALAPRGSLGGRAHASTRGRRLPRCTRGPSRTRAGVQLGEDVVVFVGGPGRPADGGARSRCRRRARVGAAAHREGRGRASGSPSCASTIPRGSTSRSVWSMYPNGLDPAPVAAAASQAHDLGRRACGREAAEAGRRRVLEARRRGSGEGAFVARDVVPTTADAPTRRRASRADAHGAPVALRGSTASGSWVERLAALTGDGGLRTPRMNKRFAL